MDQRGFGVFSIISKNRAMRVILIHPFIYKLDTMAICWGRGSILMRIFNNKYELGHEGGKDSFQLELTQPVNNRSLDIRVQYIWVVRVVGTPVACEAVGWRNQLGSGHGGGRDIVIQVVQDIHTWHIKSVNK